MGTINNLRTLEQNRLLHWLIGQLGIDKEIKSVLVDQYTNGRCKSSADMSVSECRALMERLARDLAATQPDYSHLPGNEQRRYVCHLMHLLGWTYRQHGNQVLDFARLGKHLHRHPNTYHTRMLNDLSSEQLSTLINQLTRLI